MTEKSQSNPFHPEAVATYGRAIRTCEHLGYMATAKQELDQYLIDYPDSEKQFGAAIGLRGGHGSGKTHLLMWLAQIATGREHSRPIVIYAKADRASFFDLYVQFLNELSREKLQGLMGEALQNLAREQIGKAKATESIGERINRPEDLDDLDKERQINLEQLVIQLQYKLENEENVVPGAIPRTLTLITHHTLGDMAFQWLRGNEVSDPKALGLSHQLLQIGQEQQGSAAPDTTAVNALETIAALFRIAQRPLIVLIDQLEILLRADPTRQDTLFSVLKKMIEQLNRQRVLTLIAGNEESWDILPRDVPPRLRLRQPLQVGNLSLEETRSLLESYTDALPSQLDSDATKIVHALSGGNPREIIRIAYYAYKDTAVKGRLDKVNKDALIRSANESSTIEGRNTLALIMADLVLKDFGDRILKELAVGEHVSLERLLMVGDTPRLALGILKATDKLSEISSARRLNTVREYVERTWPSTPLVSVTVGYSSSEVEDLIGRTGTVIQYDEKNFVSQLYTKVAELLTRQSKDEPKTVSLDPAVLDSLREISKRLDSLEVERGDEIAKIAERFAEKARINAEPARRESELRTRWDLLAAIDDLQRALTHSGPEREREIIRSILVANESHLKIAQVDHLGGVYLDLLSGAADSWPPAHGHRASSTNDLERRMYIVRELRHALRAKNLSNRLIDRPLRYALFASAMVGLVETLIFLAFNQSYLQDVWKYEGFSFWLWFMRRIAPSLLFTLGAILAATYLFRWFRIQKWESLRRL